MWATSKRNIFLFIIKKFFFPFQKIARRIAAIDQMADWNDEKKERGKKVFTIEYTSSDESEVSDD